MARWIFSAIRLVSMPTWTVPATPARIELPTSTQGTQRPGMLRSTVAVLEGSSAAITSGTPGMNVCARNSPVSSVM